MTYLAPLQRLFSLSSRFLPYLFRMNNRQNSIVRGLRSWLSNLFAVEGAADSFNNGTRAEQQNGRQLWFMDVACEDAPLQD